MSYSKIEIQNIKRLATNADLKNNLIAFEIISNRGLVPELFTDIYWIYNRLIWSKDNNLEKKVLNYIQKFLLYKKNNTKITPLLDCSNNIKLSLDPDFETMASSCDLNKKVLAELLFKNFPINHNPINNFLFKYGSTSIQEQILPFLKVREHNGNFLLDLGGFKLKTVPNTILLEKNIQTLKLWGNELKELPDFWDHFQELTVLNIAENNLTKLPASFSSLTNLNKLYAQNNNFDLIPALNTIKQLPKIKHISIATTANNTGSYTKADNDELIQFEELVNHGKIYAPEKEQLLFLGLVMNNALALEKLSLLTLFEALSNEDKTIRYAAKLKIANWKDAGFNGELPEGSSIAILGIISFSVRNKLNNEFANISCTTDINEKTTHIMIGDFPENYKAVEDRKFIFLTEEDL